MKVTKLLSEKNLDFPSYKPVTAVFLGDSITHGSFEIYKGHDCQIDGTYDYEEVYHNKLKKMLSVLFKNAPLNVINAGICGGSAPQGFARIERDVLPYSPDLAVVCFGLNDSGGGLNNLNTYSEALTGIFRKLKDNNIETIFMTPNMMNTYVSPLLTDQLFRKIAESTAEIQNNGTMDSYMKAAKDVCTEEGIRVCDCYRKWKKLYEAGVDTTALLANHINHPIREMHRLFAESLFDILIFDE